MSVRSSVASGILHAVLTAFLLFEAFINCYSIWSRGLMILMFLVTGGFDDFGDFDNIDDFYDFDDFDDILTTLTYLMTVKALQSCFY